MFIYYRLKSFFKNLPLFLILFLNPLFSQIQFSRVYNPADSTFLKTDFSKQNITWNWKGEFQSIQHSPDWFNWDFNDTYSSNLITPSNTSKRWKDQHNLKGLFYKNHNRNSYGLYTKSWILLDKQQDNIIEYSNHSAGLFTTFFPEKVVNFTPYLGYQRAKNISKTDWGWDAGITAKVTNYQLGEYNTNITGSSDYDFFDARQNYNNKFVTSLVTQFTPYTRDSIQVGYEESSKQFYNITGDDIVEVKLYSRKIKNRLFYALSPSNIFTFETRIESKNVSYFTRRDQFFIENRFVLKHFGSTFNYEIDFRTNDETLDNQKTITDSRTRQSAIGIKTEYRYNSKNNLGFNIAYVKLQHDTPDENNKDDRDEQRFVMDLSYQREISPVLYFMFDVYGFLYHQIYLFSPQSGNNNWNRVLKLSPEIQYKTKMFSNRLSTSVLANYTVYDFDHLNLKTRSFLSRKYTISDSALVKLSNTLSLGFHGRMELEEKGNFFEKQFAQNLIQSYKSGRINTYLAKRLYLRFNLKLGYTYYKRSEWRYLPVKRRNRDLINKGPFMSVNYKVINRLNLSAFAAINFVDDSRSRQSSFNTGYLRMVYNL